MSSIVQSKAAVRADRVRAQKTPLTDHECESNLLATMLRGGEPCFRALAALSLEDFTAPGHGGIFAAIARIVGQGREVSYPSVRLALQQEDRKILEAVVESGLPMPSMVNAWVERLLYLSRLRELHRTCHEVVTVLDGSELPQDDWLAGVSERLGTAMSGRRADQMVISPERWPQAMYEEACRRRGDTERFGYLRWGMPQVEQNLALQAKDMMFLAAETGRGKTMLALSMAYAVAVKDKQPTLYVNSEMGWEQLAFRLAQMGRGISAHSLRAGMLSEHDLCELDAFRRQCDGNRLWLTDAVGALSMDRVVALARQYKAQGLKVLIVDYIQRLFAGAPRAKDEQEWQMFVQAAGRLKNLAQELGIIAVVVAQLSREWQLARGGQMAHECDAMLTLHHRDDLPPQEQKRLLPTATHVLRVAKARHGIDRQEMQLCFDPAKLTFEEMGWLRGR